MDTKDILTTDQIHILNGVYLLCLTPSVIGSFSVLVVSIVRRRHLTQQVHLLVQLALADLLAALILMVNSVMNIVGVHSSRSVVICQYSLPLSLTFYFISFLLVVIYAWNSKNAIGGWRARPEEDEAAQSQCRRKTLSMPVYVLVWLIPLVVYVEYTLTSVITAASVIPTNRTLLNSDIDNKSQFCSSCILFLHFLRDSCPDPDIIHDTFIKGFLFLAVIPAMLSCSVIYYKVGKWYERHQHQGLFPVEGDGRSRRRVKTVFSTARNMVLVILFCWAPALVLIVLSTLMTWTNIQQSSLFFLYVIQAGGVSLQGFLNSMVYGWRRPNFTEAVLGEHTPLLAQERSAFFDESLPSSC